MAETVSSIPKILRVTYDTYALFPTSQNEVGDLAYATDRKTLYRWNGAAWQPITIYSGSGTAANIPGAATLPDGSLYYETDTALTKQIQGGVWVTIAATMQTTSGTYTGNDGANRAIPHGLGRIPKVVIIMHSTGDYLYHVSGAQPGAMLYGYWAAAVSDGGVNGIATALDATNFYVGHAVSYPKTANATGQTYNWFAIG